MTAITRFEEIQAWQQGRELARLVYAVTAQGEFARDFALRDQIRRATISVLSNIAEGFERGGNKEFRHFLSIARGSAGEVRAQLYVALDVGLLSQQQFDELHPLVTQTGRLIAGLMRYLDQSAVNGAKLR